MAEHWEHWLTAVHQVPGVVFCPFRPAQQCLTLLICVSFVGLCPDWETWDPVKPVENATEAMQLADDWLGIPQVRAATQTLLDCKSLLCKPFGLCIIWPPLVHMRSVCRFFFFLL